MTKKIEDLASSGNIYADAGLPNAEALLAKTKLAIRINDLIKRKKLTQADVALLLDIDKAKVALLSCGMLASFSLETIFGFLLKLGQDITIDVAPKARSKKQGKISVHIFTVKKVLQ